MILTKNEAETLKQAFLRIWEAKTLLEEARPDGGFAEAITETGGLSEVYGTYPCHYCRKKDPTQFGPGECDKFRNNFACFFGRQLYSKD